MTATQIQPRNQATAPPSSPTAPQQYPQPSSQPSPAPTQQMQYQPPPGGLPQTGLDQQLQSMRASYDYYRNIRVAGLGNVGTDVHANDELMQQQLPPIQNRGPMGQTSLQQLAQRLAQSYGLSLGRESLVDAEGNFNYNPEQLAEASGGQDTMGEAAAKMNYISAAIARRQQGDALKKSEAAMQAGLGLASQRRPGSMIEQQAQFYKGLSDLYQNQQYTAMDFSYYIQREHDLLQQQIYQNIQRQQTKNARANFWANVGLTVVNVVTQNWAGAAATAYGAYGSSEGTGYF